MPKIKNAPTAEGGYFDPHNHFTGILPYRVLALLTAEGAQFLRLWKDASPFASALAHLDDRAIEDFLAHHTVDTAGPLKPPHAEEAADRKALSTALHDLETRLVFLQNFSLHWGMAVLPDGDKARLAENAGTIQKTLLEGDVQLDKLLTGKIAKLAATMKLGRPSPAALLELLNEINGMSVPLDAEYETGLPRLVRHVNQNVLTATPQNDYDSAYVARGLLAVEPADLLAAGMRELERQNIVYSEQSVPLWTLTGRFKDVAADAVEAAGVTVRWLPMLAGSFLGWIGGSHEPAEATVRTMLRLRDSPPDDVEPPLALRCIAGHLPRPYADWALRWAEFAPMPWPERRRPAMHEDLGEWIDRLRSAIRHEVRYATGFDIASPERTWYTPDGGRQLERILRMTFEVAREQRRPLVAHIHVGEGYPAFADTSKATLEPTAKRSSQSGLRILYDTRTKLPAHYLCTENNVEQTLRAVLRLREALSREEGGRALSDFDRYVRVRFGHVTHASVVQAQQMAEANIWADVNLTSNLATGALSFPEVGVGAIQAPRNPGVLKRAVELVSSDENAGLFAHHALVTLLTCGVPTVLGTDGSGVEHSDMTREYALAEALLRLTAERVDRRTFTLLSSAKREMPLVLSDAARESLKRRLSIGRLYENQSLHHEWTESWTQVPPPRTSPSADGLAATLHKAFLNAAADK